MTSWTYEQFKENIFKASSIDLNAYKERQMKRRIDSLIGRYGPPEDYAGFYNRMMGDPGLYQRFIEYLTINVSEFYRNPDQWDHLEKCILPDLLKLPGALNIWSSACSTGEEPYSLAILLSRFLPLHRIHILATDLDAAVLRFAAEGVYPKKSLERVPPKWMQQFVPEGGAYRIPPKLKTCVTFRPLNLLQDPYPKSCHLILCRNVLIYFTDPVKDQLYHRFREALSPGGILFVGNTEQILHPAKYGLETVQSFFYRRPLNR